MEPFVDLFIRGLSLGLTTVLFAVAILAARRHGKGRLWLVALAFGLMWTAMIAGIASWWYEWDVLTMDAWTVIVLLGVQISLYLAILRE